MLRILMVCLMVAVGLTACGGGGAEVKSEIHTTTKGQNLLDLKKAYEAGAMSEKEYEREREIIMNKQ